MEYGINETYIKLNKVSTRISTLGKNIGDSFEDTDDLVIIIPGNPGVNRFYDKFAKRINEKLNCSVWCVGHAGHNVPKKTLETLPQFEENKTLYGLKGQVQHKLDFFEKYVPKNARVHLIGHSIGSYMVLELLDNPSVSKLVNNSYLLFPTIEYMADTKNGKILVNFVKPIVRLVIFFSGLFCIFPKFIQTALLYGYMTIVGMPKYNCESIRELVKPSVLERVFFLAYEEMDHVLERKNDSIKKNIDKIKFYYGRFDGWTPLTYYNNIKEKFSDINAELTNINHAFVLKSSNEMGDIVCDWITSEA